MYAGLDLSLTATGLIVLSRRGKVIRQVKLTTTHNGDEPYDDQVRQAWIVHSIMLHLDGITQIGIEGHAFGVAHKDSRLIELAGAVKMQMWKQGIEFQLVPVGSLKQFATGNGRASKDEMLAAARADGYPAPEHNMADAYWVAKWMKILAS